MTLIEKIKQIYPSLTDDDFSSSIILQNDLDGVGDYIADWSHPTFEKPTEDQLKGI